MNKRGQITIFILVGLLIFIIISLLIYTSSQIKEEPLLASESDQYLIPLKQYTESCIKQVLEEGLVKVGFNNFLNLEHHIDSNLKTCTNNFNSFSDLDIVEGTVNSKLSFSSNNLSLILNVDYTLDVRKGGSTSTISEFYTTYELTSHKILQTSNEVTSSQTIIDSNNLLAKLIIPNETELSRVDGQPLYSIAIDIQDNFDYPGDTIGYLAYDLRPEGAQFDPSIELLIEYDEDLLPDNIKEENLKIGYYDNGNWTEWVSIVDSENNIITAYVHHFTPHSIIFEPEEEGYDNKQWGTINVATKQYGEGPTDCGSESNNYGDGWNYPQNMCSEDSSTSTHKADYGAYYLSTIPDITGEEVENIGNVTIKASFTTGPGIASVGLLINDEVYKKDIILNSSPQFINLVDLKDTWSFDEIKNSKLLVYSSIHNFKVDSLRLFISELNERVIIKGTEIDVNLPLYCEIDRYHILLKDSQEDNITYYNESFSNNEFSIDTNNFNCRNGYTLLGGYIKNNTFVNTLTRQIDCDLAILTDPRYESDETRDCMLKGVCNVNFAQRCMDNIWVGCNYPSTYSSTERCDGLDNNCDGRFKSNEYIYSTGNEICNGKDDDCDGGIDEGLDCYLPIKTGGEGFLYKPATDLILLPPRMYHTGPNFVDRMTLSTSPSGTPAICTLFPYEQGFGNRAKFRYRPPNSNCNPGRVESMNNFYVVAFFAAGGSPQPYLIADGGSRQE